MEENSKGCTVDSILILKFTSSDTIFIEKNFQKNPGFLFKEKIEY